MKLRRCILVALVLAAAGPMALAGQGADVEASIAETLEAWRAGDIEAFAAHYHPETRGFFFDGGQLVAGMKPEALRAAWDAGFRADLTLEDLEVEVFGDTAVSAARLVGTLTVPGGAQVEGPWRYTETRVRTDGGWKVVQYHFSPAGTPGAG